VPFSKGLLGQSLTATGLPPHRAHHVALQVEEQLLRDGVYELNSEQLDKRVEAALAETEGPLHVERYRKWQSLGREDRPVIILIGGTTGVGKSTLATTLAHRLGIVRIISTDTIRQVMRAFFSATFMPAIHYSSFDADEAVRIPVGKSLDPHILGFVEQIEAVNVGVTAIVQRAATEKTGMVLEGVHLVPGFMEPEGWEDALVLPMIVVVRDEELHRAHFLVRDRETDGTRPHQRYLDNFAEIRKIQDFILSRAEEEGTLIIDNLNIDDTVGVVVDHLYERIADEPGA
jgi:2-phosphoglycerate kinase